VVKLKPPGGGGPDGEVVVGIDGVVGGTVRQAWLTRSSRCPPKASKSVTNM